MLELSAMSNEVLAVCWGGNVGERPERKHLKPRSLTQALPTPPVRMLVLLGAAQMFRNLPWRAAAAWLLAGPQHIELLRGRLSAPSVQGF